MNDITGWLQGGALAAVGAILAPTLIREVKRMARRGIWQRVRRSPVYKQWFGLALDLLPYGLIAALAYGATHDARLMPFVIVPLFTAAIARRRKHKVIAYILLTILAGALCNLVINDSMFVVWITGLVRYIWPYMWGKS